MIPSFKPGIMSSNRIRAAAGADVTPNAVNWGNMTYISVNDAVEFREQQITGINQQITIRIKTTSSSADFIYYRVANTASSLGDGNVTDIGTFYYYADGLADGFYFDTPQCVNTTGFTLNVSNNQYVGFGVAYGRTTPITIQIVNTSDGNAVLDTFTLTSL